LSGFIKDDIRKYLHTAFNRGELRGNWGTHVTSS